MDVYIYSDESGVFDKAHNTIFVFGGLLFLSKEDKEIFTRKYLHAERALRINGDYEDISELKASHITNKDKSKLYRATNQCFRFGVIIHQDRMLNSIFEDKKSKQRFLDYAFKLGLKRFLQNLMDKGIFLADDIDNINVCVDEHSTSTNGKYELSESLLQEFKYGTYNYNWSKHFPPIFPNMGGINLIFSDSSKKPLIRAADIIANKIWHAALNDQANNLSLFIVHLP